MDIAPNETHYLTFAHATSGLTLGAFTIGLFKNGENITSIEVSMKESPLGFYSFFFRNDGIHKSQWTLIVYQTAAPTNKYSASWQVLKPIIESNIKLVRNQIS